MSLFWNPDLQNLSPYVPGEQPKHERLIKLNTNESPYGPSPKALAAIAAGNHEGLRLYPDPDAKSLKEAIANHYGLEPNQVFVGNGSDEVLAHVFLGLLKHPKPLLFPDITYSFYPVYCQLFGIDYQTIALDSQFAIHLDDYLQKTNELGGNGGVIFPNPNAPTGRALPRAAIEAFLKTNTQSVVVVDEAYVDYGTESCVPLLRKHYPNLLITHTLSKSRALAGLRVGYALGHPDLIAGLERVKNSFNSYPLGQLAQAGAIAAIEDQAHLDAITQEVMRTRAACIENLKSLGFNTLPSSANFVFTQHPKHDGEKLYLALRERGIIVRHFKTPRIKNYLRITIGTNEQMSILVDALRDIVS
ncbi:histidinol-phosphate transaminase [Polynucleobacter sp. MWH-UH24A]|uniref:histidinol-phosphate transaminase n=1 Tax=Polynucleobacter sp. MWH-UH24A TaxID=2689110 RepID=UPI001BFDE33B|nr:histidinol-phosphate transaminase [Polynucleobacter sp. MWH-UH24A]QWD76205.1 histidinol-phosphate transaminase [Polynucleobacter sp. MWH-UH24A]